MYSNEALIGLVATVKDVLLRKPSALEDLNTWAIAAIPASITRVQTDLLGGAIVLELETLLGLVHEPIRASRIEHALTAPSALDALSPAYLSRLLTKTEVRAASDREFAARVADASARAPKINAAILEGLEGTDKPDRPMHWTWWGALIALLLIIAIVLCMLL